MISPACDLMIGSNRSHSKVINGKPISQGAGVNLPIISLNHASLQEPETAHYSNAVLSEPKECHQEESL